MDMTNVDKAVALMIERAVNGVDAAVAFGAAQLPDIIRQLLVWKTTQYIFLVLLFAVALAVCVAVAVRTARRYRAMCTTVLSECSGEQSTYDRQRLVEKLPDPSRLLLVLTIGAIVSGVIMAVRICYLLQILIAPKVWLLEYARDLLT